MANVEAAPSKIIVSTNIDSNSEVYTHYLKSQVFIKKALESESGLDRAETLHLYQSAITVLEECLGRNIKKIDREQFTMILPLMLKALECCRSRSYVLDDDRRHVWKEQNCSNIPVNGTTVELLIPGGVQLFLVQENKEFVPISKNPTKLQAIVLAETDPELSASSQFSMRHCYIKVGAWNYQLVYQTEVEKWTNELYLFPFGINTNVSTDYKGFGIVISDRLTPAYRYQFERFLDDNSTYTAENIQSTSVVINLSKTVRLKTMKEGDDVDDSLDGNFISENIDYGAKLLSCGLMKGAEMASNFIYFSSNTLNNNVEPLPQPTLVNPYVERTAEFADNLTSRGVQATGFIVDGITKITKVVTPHLMTAAQSVHFQAGSSSPAINNAIVVAKSGAQGVGKVLTGIEEASSVICRAVVDATVDTVNHRCGPNAARDWSHATSAAMNVGRTINNINHMGVKTIVKEVTKDLDREFLEKYVALSPCSTADPTDETTELERDSSSSFLSI